MPVRAERSTHVIFLNRIVFVAETKVEAVSQPMLRTASKRVGARRTRRQRGAAAVVEMGSAERMIELLTRGLRGAGLPCFEQVENDGKLTPTRVCARQEVLYFCLHSFTPVLQLGVSQLIRGEGFCFFPSPFVDTQTASKPSPATA